MTTIGIYLRLSLDRDGTQTATARQRADCERYAESRGWNVVDIFENVDLSAYQRGVHRPEFERMLEAVREKQIDGVLAWKVDRITRRMRDLVRLDEACEDAGGFIATVVENIDTRTTTGRFVLELLVAQARMESENTSVRMKRKHEEIASGGKPIQGGHRLFGYERGEDGTRQIVPAEAELIREARDRVFAGETAHAIAADWQHRGVMTTKGNVWRNSTLRRMLKSAAISGQREHRGKLTPGNWEPIISAADTARLRAMLRRGNSPPTGQYLLTGLVHCGHCGRPLWGHRREDGVRRYVCARQPGNGNCGRLGRVAEPVEDVVREAVLVALDGVDLREHVERAREDADSVAVADALFTDEAALEELSEDYYTTKTITRPEFLRARDVLTARIEQNRRLLMRGTGSSRMSEILGAGKQLRRQWDEQDVKWQREVISTVVDRIDLLPAVRGRNKFDPSLVRIVWRF